MYDLDNAILLLRSHFIIGRKAKPAAEDVHTDISSFHFLNIRIAACTAIT